MIRVRIQKKSKSGKGSRSSGSAYVGGYASREYSGTVAEAVHAQHAGELDAGSKTRSELLEAAAGYTDAQKAEVLESVANDYLSKEAAAEGYVSKTKDDTVGGVLTFIKGLMSKALSVFEKGLQIGANFISGTKNSGAQIDERGNGELESLVIRSLLQSSGFIGGFGGQGVRIYQDGNGEWNIESDTLTVRGTLRVYELLIDRLRAVGGQVVVSKANGKVKAVEVVEYINGAEEQPEEVVEEIVGGDGIATYKKALSAGAGDIEPEPVEEEPVEVETYYKMSFEDACPFVMGDLIRCQKFTGKSLKHYWVEVVNVARDYAYVSTSDDGLYSGVPAAGDEVVLCGNVTDTTRQAAILISAAQEATGQPIVSVLSGINSRSFEGCLRTRLGYLGDIRDNDLGGQLSGYGLYGENVFLKGTFLLKNGNTYVEVGENIKMAVGNLVVGKNLLLNSDFSDSENFKKYYGWNYIYDTVQRITTDLPNGITSGVQFTAEQGGYGVYTKDDLFPPAQPCLPLEAGKTYTLSFYGRVTSGTPQDNNFYFGLENASTNIVTLTSDWQRFSMTFTPTQAQVGEALVFYSQKAGNYAITGLKLEEGGSVTAWEDTQAKIEVLSNRIGLSVTKGELEVAGVHIDGENSKIFLNAQTTEVSDDLIVRRLQTKVNEDGLQVKVDGGIVEASHELTNQRALFGLNENGQLVLQWWRNGELVCDWGPDGVINKTEGQPEGWSDAYKLVPLGTAAMPAYMKIDMQTVQGNSYYKYKEGWKKIGNYKRYYNPESGQYDRDTPPEKTGCLFVSKNYSAAYVPDGWYRKENLHGNYPAEIYNHQAGIDEDIIQIYCLKIYKYESGRMTDYAEVYFRDKGNDILLEEGKGRLTKRDGTILMGNYPYLYSYYKNEVEL